MSSARNAGESAIWHATLVRKAAGELEAENWRWGAGRVQLEGVEYLGSWKMSTGDCVVQL